MLRKQFIGLSVLSFFSLLTKKVFGDTAIKPKMATTLKNFFSCTADQKVFTFSFDPYFPQGWIAEDVGSLPSGFVEAVDANDNIYGYIVTAPAVGNYTLGVRAKALPADEWTSFDINFEIVNTCATEQSVCCGEDSIGIRWIGRTGGIKQWNFNGVKTFDVRVGDANKFKNNNLQAQYSERSNIYNGKVITSGNITRDQSDFLDELKYAIQAWEWDGETATPILINNESFDKYKSTQKFYDVSLAYILAEEIRIQTQ